MMSIEERIAALERSNHRYRIVTCISALSIAVLLVMGFKGNGVQEEIRTKRLVVVNSKGKNRITLDNGEDPWRKNADDGGSVILTGPNNYISASISADSSGGTIFLSDTVSHSWGWWNEHGIVTRFNKDGSITHP